jgi:hypothetical protein
LQTLDEPSCPSKFDNSGPANANNDVHIGKLSKKRSPPKVKKALVVMNDRSLGILKHPVPLSVLWPF